MAVDDIVAGLKAASALIDLPELEPTAARADWGVQAQKLDELSALFANRVLATFSQDLTEVASDEHNGLRDVVARVGAMTAGALGAAGRTAEGQALLAKVAAIAATPQLQGELSVARQHFDWFCKLNHARWLDRAAKDGAAKAVFEEVRRGSPTMVFRNAAAAVLDAPEPVKSAPPLFTFNSFGVGLYGNSAPKPDGSYVTTLCVCALFLPLFPIRSYRVMKQGTRYLFMHHVRLTTPWSWYRRIVAAAVVLLIAGTSVQAYLESPSRLARIAVENAVAVDSSGKAAEAARLYDEALTQYSAPSFATTLAPAAAGWLRLQLAKIKEPFSADQLDLVRRIQLRFQQINIEARRDPTTTFVTRLLGWTTQIGAESAEAQETSLALLELASAVALRADTAAVQKQQTSLRQQIAAGLVDKWPLHALEHYVKLGNDPQAIAAGSKILASLADEPSLVLENEALLTQFVSVAPALAPQLKDALTKARAMVATAGRAELLESNDVARLKAHLAKFPRDQDARVAIAGVLRRDGKPAEATGILEALGPVGVLSADGHLMLAVCAAEAGVGDLAAPMLDAWLRRWLPYFQRSKNALIIAVDAAEERLVADARAGRLPTELQAQLDAEQNEKKAQEIFREWLSEQLSNDPALQLLRNDYSRHRSGVTTASLLLGTLELEQANKAAGEEHKKLLESAERRFLAVQQEAEGTPTYQLSYGKVLHRLGKGDQGDTLFKELLAGAELGMHLEVGEAYRELGLVARANTVFEGVYDAATLPAMKDSAAMSLYVAASGTIDREKWLNRVTADSPSKRASLAELRGDLLATEGKLAEADQQFALAAAFYEKTAKGNSTSANNAGAAYSRRYQCQGNLAQLDKAITSYRASVRMAPDNTIVLDNLATVLADRAMIGIAAKWVKTPVLRLNGDEAETLVRAIRSGSHDAEVLALLRADPRLRESVELMKKISVLAPRKFAAYENQADWYQLIEDDAALIQVVEQAQRIGGFDDSDLKSTRAQFESGAMEEQIVTGLTARIKELEAAGRDAPPPTRAAARLLESVNRSRLCEITGKVEDAQAALAATRDAEAWPDLAAAKYLPGRLVALAFARARALDPQLDAAWQKDRRRLSPTVLLFTLASQSPAFKQSLVAQPELKQAATVLAQRPANELGLEDWVLAWILDDAALMKRSSENMRKISQRQEMKLARLYFTSDGWKTSLDLFDRATAQ